MIDNSVTISNISSFKDDVVSLISSARTLDFLHPELVVVGLRVISRKRLFEELARLISQKSALGLEPDEIFTTLHERERLGSTGLGKGIAVPHGRLDELPCPVLAVAKLQTAIDYDTPDGHPVWLAACLLVPRSANKVHLDLLSRLVSKFSEDPFLDQVKGASTSHELYDLFTEV